MLATVAERGIVVCPTLGRAPDAIAPPQLVERMRKAGLDLGARAGQMAHAHRVGVRIITGTDGGINPGKAHGILPSAVIALVSGGLSPAEALATATSLAADPAAWVTGRDASGSATTPTSSFSTGIPSPTSARCTGSTPRSSPARWSLPEPSRRPADPVRRESLDARPGRRPQPVLDWSFTMRA